MKRLLSIAPSLARWTCGTVVLSLYDALNPATREKLPFSTSQHVHSPIPYSSHLRCLSSTHLNRLSRQRYCTFPAPYRNSRLRPSISHPLYFSSQQEQVRTNSSNRPSCSRLLISIVAKPSSIYYTMCALRALPAPCITTSIIQALHNLTNGTNFLPEKSVTSSTVTARADEW
jgi:hypothetical protein